MNSKISKFDELENLSENKDITELSSLNPLQDPDTNSNYADHTTEIRMPSLRSGQNKESEIDDEATTFGATKRLVAKGMMDIALLTANANQLRFLIIYNSDSKTFYVNFVLIVLSLVLQIVVGIALIFKTKLKHEGKKDQADRTNDFLVVGVFMITIINVFVASFTTAEPINK